MSGPREDRYKLLRATGVNTSPVVGLYDDTDGAARPVLDAITARTADVDLTDDDGTRHRLWAIPADGDATEVVAPLLAAASRGPVTIADGHHRYETALRYRDERRMTRSCEEDPAFDYVLMLLLDGVGEPLTVLPTHRIVGGLGETGWRACWRVSTRCSRSGATSPQRSCAGHSAARDWRAAARVGSVSGRGPAARC